VEILKQKIQEEINLALKGRKETVLSTLRVLLAAVLSREKEKRYKIAKDLPENKNFTEQELVEKSQLSDQEIIEVLATEVKKRKDSITEFEKGGRKDLAVKEKAEIEILQKYLPEQMSGEEVEKIVKEAVEKTGAKEIRDMGKVMSQIMPRVKGRADGTMVSSIVKKMLGAE
jgi:uncharacterized protein YqeY